MYVSIAVLRTIVGELERQGLAGCATLEAAGLDREILADAGGAVAVGDYARVIEEAIARCENPALGLLAGWHAPTGAAHVLGFVLVSSATLREAIQMFLRYSSLVVEGAEWSFAETEDEARFGFLHPQVSGDVARFEAEMLLTYVFRRIALHFLGRSAPLQEARFAHVEPCWVETYHRIFGCPVSFGAERNELVFHPAALDVSQLHSDTWVCELLKERAEVILRERRSDARLRTRVKDVLKYQLPRGQAQAEDVARAIGLTPRTLRRRLSNLGCTLRELSDEARKELACEGILSPKRSIKDVAYDLGFAEPSAFHRAFKRWTGLTPHQFRLMHSDDDGDADRAGARAASTRESAFPGDA